MGRKQVCLPNSLPLGTTLADCCLSKRKPRDRRWGRLFGTSTEIDQQDMFGSLDFALSPHCQEGRDREKNETTGVCSAKWGTNKKEKNEKDVSISPARESNTDNQIEDGATGERSRRSAKDRQVRLARKAFGAGLFSP